MKGLTGFSPSTCRTMKLRAGLDEDVNWVRCEGCGRWFDAEVVDGHHRRPRGAGGSKRPDTNLASNGLMLCRVYCHPWAESQRDEARDDRGWLISQFRKDVTPSQVPVLLHDGWFLLDDHGGRWAVPNPHREAS